MMTPTLINNLPPTSAGCNSEAQTTGETTDILSAEFAAMFASFCATPPVTTPETPVVSEVVETPVELPQDLCVTADAMTTIPVTLPVGPVITPEKVEAEVSEILVTEGEVESASGTGLLAYNPNATSKIPLAPRNTTTIAVQPTTSEVEATTSSTDTLAFDIDLPHGKTVVTPRQSTTIAPLPTNTAEEPPISGSQPTLTDTPEPSPVEEVFEVPTPAPTPGEAMSKGLPVAAPAKPVEPGDVDEKAKRETIGHGSAEIVRESGEVVPETVKVQAEATRRISNLIATYLLEGSKSGSIPATARFAGLEFELEIDPAARQKRQGLIIDSRIGEQGISLRPFSQLTSEILAKNDVELVSQVSQRVIDLVKSSTRDIETLSFRLKPAELGNVDLKLTRHKDGSISAHLRADQETTQVTLSRSVEELRESLERAGFQIAKLQITLNSQPTNGGRRESENTSQQARELTANGSTFSNETEAGSNSSADNHLRLLSLRA
jgi:hypothetical protein